MKEISSNEYSKTKMIEYFSRMLIGPSQGINEKLQEKERPTDRYLMAILYPHNMTADSIQSEDEDTISAPDADENPDTPLSMTFQKLPASVGVSFFVEGDADLECEVNGAAYKLEACNQGELIKSTEADENDSGILVGKVWKRVPLTANGDNESVIIKKSSTKRETKIDVLNGSAHLHTIWRRMGGGYLTTVTLVNAVKATNPDVINKEDIESSIFQVGLKCRPKNGVIKEYPSRSRYSFDQEEEELALQYIDKKTYGVGHGCAAKWNLNSKNNPEYIAIEFLPTVDVKKVTTKIEQVDGESYSEVLRFQFLADDNLNVYDLCRNLEIFVGKYSDWLKTQENTEVESRYVDAKKRIIKRIHQVHSRMLEGIECLKKDPIVHKAFILANRAMLLQMIRSSDSYAGQIRDKDEKTVDEIDIDSAKFHSYSWRPFQLAFQILALESVVNPESPDRNTVDLIWFPTGGGKTEAYLGLAAFEMFYRRLKYGKAGLGTAILKRYTLRLLTTQQFERAATLICSMEYLREKMGLGLGAKPFSLGLWVGEKSSPNKYADAHEKFETVLDQEEPINIYQLQRCPWCGTRIVPRHKMEDSSYYGIRSTDSSFSFYCPTDSCDFHEKIPLSVVDEDLFDNPPTMLIGTVDKFARLAWDDRASVFFGYGTDTVVKPPSLIIQDELHLISGPLGTIAGVYEAAVDTVIENLGQKAKVVAATATIRRAEDQVQKIYGKNVQIFPPPGISADDSYYALTEDDELGRFYIGVMGQGHTPMTSLVRTAAVISQSVMEIDIPDEAVDTWWTQVIYHNSRRELGKTMTMARDDIPARVQAIAEDEDNMRQLANIEELSANIRGEKIPDILKVLKINRPSDDTVDILACTNMISVGVDISRLGIMLINGQPKTTAEYIQASSRVGRDNDRPPGLVIALYSPTKPRDRSHYENFYSYHSCLYRAVEPTSVTPYARPSRERALHAAIIILARVAGGLGANESASNFDPSSASIKKLIDLISNRMTLAEPDEKDSILDTIDDVVLSWGEKIETAERDGTPLRFYNLGGNQFASLMCHFSNKKEDCWPTLNSMRHVDQESQIRVFGEDFHN